MPRTEFGFTDQDGEIVAGATVYSKVCKCDFCSRPVGTRCFIAKDATMTVEPEATDANPLGLKELKLNSDAHWAACDGCATLIEAGDREAVLERSYENAPADIKGMANGAVYLMAIQAALFWAQYEGRSHAGAEHPEHPAHKVSV